ncbi:MAG: FAD-binding oxidoreductase [Acidimicrobiales bacterium]
MDGSPNGNSAAPARRIADKPSGPVWQGATVIETIKEAPDTLTLRLRLEESVGFAAGQYYNVRMSVPGRPRPVQRAYSVGSSPLPDPRVIDIGVRELPGGLVSPRLVRETAIGDQLKVRGPYGRFIWNDRESGAVVLVGAGSGLVPLMSMVRHAKSRGHNHRVWLICSAITYEHALYRDELSALQAAEPWLDLTHCVTRDPAEHNARFHRRIDRDVLNRVLRDETPARAYVCGPPAMVETVTTALEEIGLDPHSILTEKYD